MIKWWFHGWFNGGWWCSRMNDGDGVHEWWLVMVDNAWEWLCSDDYATVIQRDWLLVWSGPAKSHPSTAYQPDCPLTFLFPDAWCGFSRRWKRHLWHGCIHVMVQNVPSYDTQLYGWWVAASHGRCSTGTWSWKQCTYRVVWEWCFMPLGLPFQRQWQ